MKLDAISIVTAHMPSAVTFYTALGLELVDGGPEAPHSEFSSGSIRILLDTEEVMLGIDPEWTWPTGGHKMSLAFDCSSPEAVDASFAELTAGGKGVGSSQADPSESSPVAGIVHEPWDAFWGQRYAVVSDPDGNTVDLFATFG